MADRPKPEFEVGTRVCVPCYLIDKTVSCVGTILIRRWQWGDGGRPDAWYYTVDLDQGGQTLAREANTERLDAVTRLGELAL